MMTRSLLALLLLAATPALADTPKKPDAAALKKANNHFKLGQEFFKSGQWDNAIAEYQAALDLTGEPLMVFNIALALDRAGRAEDALAGYLKYLDSGPDGPVADEARGYVAKLTPVVAALKKQRDNDAAKKVEADKRVQEDVQRKADEAKRADEAKQIAAARVDRARGVDHTATIERYAGIGIAVVGAAVLGFGIKQGLDAQAVSDDLSNHTGPWTDEQIARDAEGRDLDKKMKLYTAIGGGIILGGAVLFTVGSLTHRRAERMRVGAMPLPGGGVASLLVRF